LNAFVVSSGNKNNLTNFKIMQSDVFFIHKVSAVATL